MLLCAAEVEAIDELAAEVLAATFTRIEVAVEVDGIEHNSVSRKAEVVISPSSSKEVDGTFC